MSQPTPVQQRDEALKLVASLTEKLEAASAEIKAAKEADLALTGDCTALKKGLALETAALADVELKLVSVTGELVLAKKELEDVKADFEKKLVLAASAKAAEIAAAQGIPPVKSDANENQSKVEPISAKYQKGDYLNALAAGFKADFDKNNGK